MGSKRRTDFKKERHCPSSQDLESYHRSLLASWQRSEIAVHLGTCDFCASELQLLAKVPLADNQIECPSMPASLRALAEALLADKDACSKRLRQMLARGPTASGLGR